MDQAASVNDSILSVQSRKKSSELLRFKTTLVSLGFGLLLILPTLEQGLTLSSGYKNHLPESLHMSNFDRFKSYMSQHTTIPVVDVRPALIAAKANHVTYCQTDTHRNEYGSLIATLTLANRIRQDFPKVFVARLSNYTIESIKGVGGDLVTMLALNRDIVDSIAYKIKPAKFLLAQNTETVNVENELPHQRFVTTSSQLPKLLLIGDSFSYALNQSLPGYFRESYLVRSHKCDTQLVKSEHPDVVVFEIVERNIGSLGRL